MNYKSGIRYIEKLQELYPESKELFNNLKNQILFDKELIKKMKYSNFILQTKNMILADNNLKLKHVNLQNFPTFDYGINLVKLDSWLFNELIGIEKNLYNLSGIEKLEKYLAYKKASEAEKKRILYLI